jgi:hypothetical protein
MTNLLTIPEVAPRVRKTEAAARWWLSRPDCPIKVAKIGGRLFVRENDLEAYIDAQFQEVG